LKSKLADYFIAYQKINLAKTYINKTYTLL